ncbi:MAG: phosphate acyltransferase PlsX [Acidobacteria bacterium]|nr:phosphate acyltransferase PlsX [Acidobacteriota bacterium]
MSQVRICVDAMGGDHAPGIPVDGAIAAARELGIHVTLVGLEDEIRKRLRDGGGDGLPIDVVHAPEVVEMDEDVISALRKKRCSSIRVGTTLLKEGKVDGFVSAGNTGAVMATAKMVAGTIDGVDRPALATIVPTLTGHAVLIDVGANVNCKPHHLEQFAIMGSIYAREILAVKNPRVGLMSVGEEEGKGNELTKEVFKVLKDADLNFVGNAEGRDVYAGKMDVIVCDGFTGNVILKVSESLIDAAVNLLRGEIEKGLLYRIGYIMARPAFRQFKKRLDYSEYGGAPLLGIKGVCLICHGRSPAKAIKNAVRVAGEFAQMRIADRIRTEIEKTFKKETTK